MLWNRDLLQQAQQHEARGASYFPENPPFFIKGQGSILWDVEEKRYLDFCSGFGSLPLGHRSDFLKEIVESKTALIQGWGDLLSSQAKIDYLAFLSNKLPAHLSKGVFSVTGSQAVEHALRRVFHFFSKQRKSVGFIVFSGSYHGSDLGIVPLTSWPCFHKPFASMLPNYPVIVCPWESSHSLLEEGVKLLQSQGIALGGILVEPVQGRAGIRPGNLSWLKFLRQFCDQKKAYLIFDEIFCGLGRCGHWTFAQDCQPDVVLWGKALGGGLPLSACFGTEELMNSWPEASFGLHTGTFFGQPLPCLLGLKTLQYMEQKSLLVRAQELGLLLTNALKEALGPQVVIRSQGLMIGVDFQIPGLGEWVYQKALNQGFLTLPSGLQGSSVSLIPALDMEEKDLFSIVPHLKNIHELAKNNF